MNNKLFTQQEIDEIKQTGMQRQGLNQKQPFPAATRPYSKPNAQRALQSTPVLSVVSLVSGNTEVLERGQLACARCCCSPGHAVVCDTGSYILSAACSQLRGSKTMHDILVHVCTLQEAILVQGFRPPVSQQLHK